MERELAVAESDRERLRQGLFRCEALTAQRTPYHGEIILIRPVSSLVLTAFAAVITAGLLALFIWGSYTRHSTLKGQIVSNRGLIKVYVPQFGVIVERKIAEGQKVHAGDALYVMSSERLSSSYGETQ